MTKKSRDYAKSILIPLINDYSKTKPDMIGQDGGQDGGSVSGAADIANTFSYRTPTYYNV